MEIRELKIGNRIEYLTVQNPDKWEEIVVSPVTFGRCSMEPTRFRGIDLTPELLERFGFKRTKVYEIIDEWFYKPLTIQTDSEIFMVTRIGIDDLELKYVHQLMNLYFALTGEELTLKTGGN